MNDETEQQARFDENFKLRIQQTKPAPRIVMDVEMEKLAQFDILVTTLSGVADMLRKAEDMPTWPLSMIKARILCDVVLSDARAIGAR